MFDPEVQQQIDDLTAAVNAKSVELESAKSDLAAVKLDLESLKANLDAEIEKAKASAAKEGQISVLAEIKSRCNL